MTPNDLGALYDAHAPRLYALALRITGDAGAAAESLEAAFVDFWEGADVSAGDAFRTLVRLTRDAALERRQSQTAASDVATREATPASLVEELFFGGFTLRELAERYGLAELQVKRMIRDGMAALRMQVARQE